MHLVYFLRDISDCGGIQQTTLSNIHSFNLLNNGINVSVISLYNKFEEPFFAIDAHFTNITLFEKPIDARKEYRIVKKKLNQVLNQLDYDCLIVQGTAYASFINKRLWKKNCVVVCEHGYYNLGVFGGLHWFGKISSLLHANAIVTLTKADANLYKRRNFRRIFITNISNPIESIPANHYDRNSKKIVSCGSLVKNKNFDDVIAAAKIVFDLVKDWSWHIYGDGPELRHLQQLIEESGLSDKVYLHGYEIDKDIIYKDKGLFVLTSDFEGFGMVLVEALSYSIPVIAYDVKFGPREIIEEGINGCLINAGNINELSNKVLYLIQNDSLRAEMAINSFISAQDYYPNQIVREWLDLFNFLKLF